MSVAWAERGVPAGLRPWVVSVWELRAGPSGAANRVLPDGSVDLVWCVVAPEALWGRPGAQLAARAEVERPLELLVAWLARRAADALPPDPTVRAAVGLLARDPRTRELAAALGASERGLRRRMTQDVGYGPKRLGRVLRLQRALELAHLRANGLAAVAVTAGYAGQAHLTRECTALAGVPPAALLAAS